MDVCMCEFMPTDYPRVGMELFFVEISGDSTIFAR